MQPDTEYYYTIWVYDTAIKGIGKLAQETAPGGFSRTRLYVATIGLVAGRQSLDTAVCRDCPQKGDRPMLERFFRLSERNTNEDT